MRARSASAPASAATASRHVFRRPKPQDDGCGAIRPSIMAAYVPVEALPFMSFEAIEYADLLPPVFVAYLPPSGLYTLPALPEPIDGSDDAVAGPAGAYGPSPGQSYLIGLPVLPPVDEPSPIWILGAGLVLLWRFPNSRASRPEPN